MPASSNHVAVIGGGPAGLRAAEVAARDGARVTLYESQRSVGRKFLVAGKSGLNLTNAEPLEVFATRYGGDLDWHHLLAEFSNDDLRAWANDLGIPTFVSGGNKVFPEQMKAAPLLRRWVTRLRDLGVTFKVKHRWIAVQHGRPIRLQFEHEQSIVDATHDAVVFALGGASWPQTGSDGTWCAPFTEAGISVRPLTASNCGWEVAWPPALLALEGQPLKNIVARCGDAEKAGELMVTRYGLEGAPIYHLGPQLRAAESPCLEIDLKPTFTVEALAEKLDGVSKDRTRAARRRWKLCKVASALLGSGGSARDLAARAKAIRLPLTAPRPVAEAISSAGGIDTADLTDQLMIKNLPGLFVAGEMIDWDAPTGGYLMQGCFATSSRAGKAAAQFTKAS